jgi:hypothetical protein
MTKQEALQIPELQINPDGLVEDCFYYRLAQLNKLSEEQGKKALTRLEGMASHPNYKGAFIVADMMIANLGKYGVPCAAWCE